MERNIWTFFRKRKGFFDCNFNQTVWGMSAGEGRKIPGSMI